jgi:FixJ family two-component response regulator
MRVPQQQKQIAPSLAGVVCVIDGDEGVRESLRALLRTLGLQVLAFGTAEEALARIGEVRPTCLIVELSLPGKSGMELLEGLLEQGVRIPTIGLTWDADSRTRERAARLGLMDLVEKPFVHWKVISKVEEVLARPRNPAA